MTGSEWSPRSPVSGGPSVPGVSCEICPAIGCSAEGAEGAVRAKSLRALEGGGVEGGCASSGVAR